MLLLFLAQFLHFLTSLLKWLHDLLIGFFLVHSLLLLGRIFLLGIGQFVFQLLYNVEVGVRYLLIIVLDILILLFVLLS